jgi:hypothetical protein
MDRSNMSRLLWVAVAVLVIGLLMLISGLAGGPFQHLVLPIIVILLGVVLAVVGWRRRAPASDAS